MKKTNLLPMLAILACIITFAACKKKTTTEATSNQKGTYISVAGQPQSKAPYTITLVEVANNPSAPALQSFAWASVGNSLLIVGGRTNGFHGFDSSGGSFPSKRSNTYFYVVDLDSNNTDSLPIPAKYATQLSTTNMEYYADGNTLYCIGGYGSNCPADSPKCYQTFPQLVAIDIAAAMRAISSNNAAALESSITAIEDERMRVTGGELHKIGDWFYLVVGQDYHDIYNYSGNPATGKYTEEIRQFKIENKDNKLAIKNYTAYNNLWGGNWTDQLHRRDLVVLETVMADGSTGITVYGGVFTPKNDNAYVNPIYISQKGDTPAFALDTVFAQKFCLYAAPTVAMYDNNEKAMYTTVLGGISQYFYDSAGNLVNSNGSMPFTNNVTTIARGADNGSVEYPQQTPVLPGATGLIGAEAVFVPDPSMPIYPGTKKVIDYSKLPAQGDVVLGLMYGGISAFTAQSGSNVPSTKANNKIYKVILSR